MLREAAKPQRNQPSFLFVLVFVLLSFSWGGGNWPLGQSLNKKFKAKRCSLPAAAVDKISVAAASSS